MCVNTRAESHDIAWSSKYTFSIAYGSLIKCRKASYKTYQHVTNKLKKNLNKDEQTNHLIMKSSFQRGESWDGDHQHQPHESSRPLPHPWAFPQQSDTHIHRRVLQRCISTPCTYHDILYSIAWHRMTSHCRVWHPRARYGHVLAWSRGSVDWCGFMLQIKSKGWPNNERPPTNSSKHFRTTHTRSLVKKNSREESLATLV